MLIVHTNVPRDKISDAVGRQLTFLISEILDKPPQYVAVAVDGDASLNFGGSALEPAAVVSLGVLGTLTQEHNKKLSKGISKVLQEQIGIKPDRCMITFQSFKGQDIGMGGNTFG